LQALADNIGLGTFPPARFRFDFRHERLWQSYGDRFHQTSVLRSRQQRKTEEQGPLGDEYKEGSVSDFRKANIDHDERDFVFSSPKAFARSS
jgi:hypothetical protein